MTAKEAFRLADSIMRYDARRYDYDYNPLQFDDNRDVVAEILSIPDCMLGATYKWALSIDDVDRSPNWEKGRIMAMYDDKLHDAKWLKQGWHVQRPDGYGVVAGQVVLKRIRPATVRMT